MATYDGGCKEGRRRDGGRYDGGRVLVDMGVLVLVMVHLCPDVRTPVLAGKKPRVKLPSQEVALIWGTDIPCVTVTHNPSST